MSDTLLTGRASWLILCISFHMLQQDGIDVKFTNFSPLNHLPSWVKSVITATKISWPTLPVSCSCSQHLWNLASNYLSTSQQHDQIEAGSILKINSIVISKQIRLRKAEYTFYLYYFTSTNSKP